MAWRWGLVQESRRAVYRTLFKADTEDFPYQIFLKVSNASGAKWQIFFRHVDDITRLPS
ncbi:hypothetical protein NC652_028844 [Populus alba x Populus x berolinensis]|nr:hypothetical protein NC652_028844 [Populus alba x Populus x berolinensis]